MKFNLKLYLTEKLQSNIIINELLNDNGGFCKYYKVNYDRNSNHLYNKTKRIYNQLNKIFNDLYYKSYYKNNYEHNSYNNYTDDQYKRAYSNYMKLYTEYQKLFVRLFKDPQIDIISCFLKDSDKTLKTSLINNNINISNISDDMFTKYTYTQIKTDKTLYTYILSFINNSNSGHTIFWMRNDKTILAVSVSEEVQITAPFLYSKYENLEYFQALTSNKEKAAISTFTDTLSDGTILEWPRVTGRTDVMNSIESDKLVYNEYRDYYTTFKVGKFLSKASQLYKNTKWGENPDDYIIIYSNDITNTNDNKPSYINHQNSKLKKNETHKEDVELYVTSKFKWINDIFGNVIPYRENNGNSTLFSFMKKFEEYTYRQEYKADQYCLKLFNLNRNKYTVLKNILVSTKNINTEISDSYNELINNIKTYTEFGKTVVDYIKKSHKDTLNIVSLYSAFSYTLNELIFSANTILKMINNTKDSITNLKRNVLNLSPNKDAWSVTYNSSGLSNDVNNIQTFLKQANGYCNTLNICKENIEDLMN